jgi:hypothetical protein
MFDRHPSSSTDAIIIVGNNTSWQNDAEVADATEVRLAALGINIRA